MQIFTVDPAYRQIHCCTTTICLVESVQHYKIVNNTQNTDSSRINSGLSYNKPRNIDFLYYMIFLNLW